MTISTDIAYNPQAGMLATTGPTPGLSPSNAIEQLMQHAHAMETAHKLAVAMCASELVPAIYRGKPENGAAAILYGMEIGLNPIQSLQQIFVVHGQPSIYARTMVALVKSHGYITETIESTDTSVTFRGTDPRTGVVEESTWTIERAKKAGYTSNKKYDTDPQAMLYAKAATEVCRKLAPEVLLGIAYSYEELQLGDGTVVEVGEPIRAASKRGTNAVKERLGIASKPQQPVTETETAAVEMASKDQRQRVAIALAHIGLAGKEQGLERLEAQFGRTFASTGELTADEADTILAVLEQEKDDKLNGGGK